MDASFCLSQTAAAFGCISPSTRIEENALNPVKPTVDTISQVLMYCLDKEPEMAFICLDSGKSKRRDIYPDYKAFRERPPEWHAAYEWFLKDLRDNFSDVVQVVACPGWEADDVMASIARMATESGKRAVLCSGDKDMRQCLRKGSVNMQIRNKDEFGRPDWGFLTAEAAEISWGGLRVDQFVDYQILMGDDVDNIPGCPGVGEKTAVSLLKEYDNIENMKKADIPGKVGKNLKEYFATLEETVRFLVTLNDRVDFKNVEL